MTDRDLVVRVMVSGRDPDKTPLRDVMSGAPVFLADERGIDQCASSGSGASRSWTRKAVSRDWSASMACCRLLARQFGELAEAIRGELETP